MKLMLTITDDMLTVEQMDENTNEVLTESPVEEEEMDTDEFSMELIPMPAAAFMLGYSLSFMNEICKRAYCSCRPFLVLKDDDYKYLVESASLLQYIKTCPDFNPYKIPGVYEPDSDDPDAPLDDSVFMLTQEMLPQVCGVLTDEDCAPLVDYRRDEQAYLERRCAELDKFMRCALSRQDE